ncbi:MAG TPA: Calx-beta domain-containing protein [Pyrinomonadaceae bacterium]|nr:Calx-beta domain-containing protein [Pyrinomonadaceae bacterium]
MNLSAPVNATLGDAQGLGTILNDDAAPTVSLSLNDVSVAEGNSGTTDAVFTATLSGTTTKTVTVDVLTISESASVGSDFQSSFKTLTFAPGQTSQTFAVPVIGDALFEGNETFRVEFRNPVNATVADGAGVGTILDDDASPTVSVDDVTVTEDDGGTGSAVRAVFTVSLSSATSGQVVVGYTVASGSAVEGEDFLGVGGALMFGPGTTKQTISVPVVGDTIAEAEEQFFVNLTPMDNAVIVKSKGTGTILDDDQNKPTPFVQFDVRDRAVSEGVGFVVVNVTRSGDASKAVSVLYSTNVDNNSRAASERDDYTIALGRLDFAPGETSKSFNVLITDDSRAEREEFITLTLADPTGGAVLGNPALALLRITDNDQTDGKNPIENPEFFVRQHYRDFFTREPDAAGLGFWTNQIAECGADAACRDIRRTNVSAAFFLSSEFQETGFLAYRLHQAALDTGEHLALRPFMFDSQQIGRGVVIGQPGADAQLEANKQAFVAEFVTRPQFAAQYPATLTPAQFVDALNANTGGALTQAERDDLVNRLAAGQLTRAQVLRAVAENAEFARRQLRRAFVYMQYVGYLRRAPDQAGFDFWLGKLNDHKGDYISSEMIRSFLVSGEYIERFGP